MKKLVVLLFIVSLIVVGCSFGSDVIDKIKDPLKATYNVVDKAIPILEELANSDALSDEYKATLQIVADGAKTVKTVLEKVASIIGLDLGASVESIADIEGLKAAIEELKKHAE